MVTLSTARFIIQNFYVLPTQCVYMLYVNMRTNSDYFPIHHKLIGFYNRDAKCLLRGTDWVFKYNSGYVFYVDLRTYSDYFPIHHKLIGFYNRDEKCLQRGTDWAFKHS